MPVTDFERGYEAALISAQDCVSRHMDAVLKASRVSPPSSDPRWQTLYEAWSDLKRLPARSR